MSESENEEVGSCLDFTVVLILVPGHCFFAPLALVCVCIGDVQYRRQLVQCSLSQSQRYALQGT